MIHDPVQLHEARIKLSDAMSQCAPTSGGGMSCDDGATCASIHEVSCMNCGGNIHLDSSSVGQGPTVELDQIAHDVTGITVTRSTPE